MMSKEKRPQDWNKSEKLQAIIDCACMDEKSLSAYCRQKGIYPHHINQWKQEFTENKSKEATTSEPNQLKKLKEENKQLKSDLQRKEKALAEAAALLVLKKKPINTSRTKRTIRNGRRSQRNFGFDRASLSTGG